MQTVVRRRSAIRIITLLILSLAAQTAISQFRFGDHMVHDPQQERQSHPGEEFHLARVKYNTYGGGGSHGLIQPWWAIDYPFAEEHFFAALRRMTNITVSDVEAQLELTDDRIFE